MVAGGGGDSLVFDDRVSLELRSLVRGAPRSMRQWGEEELVLPNGPYSGLHWRASMQPVQGLLLDLYQDRRFTRWAVTGCTQSGKTLSASVLPTIYYLFEKGETCVYAVPMADMAHDKWTQDILPVIEHTRYRLLLPTKGPGSRGGRLTSVTFTNGATLRFMSAGGGDKGASGFTSRILCATEVDGYDEASLRSRESDKVSQFEGRLLAFGESARTYLECTVSIQDGRIWQEYQSGSGGRPVCRCPRCGEYVDVEREHLKGWDEAETELEARDKAHFVCASCAAPWSEQERVQAVSDCVLAHRDQTVDRAGQVQGAAPQTVTASFRWHAAHNLFYSAGYLGMQEWQAKRSKDPENAEKRLCQQFWVIPPPPPKGMEEAISIDTVKERAVSWPRGLCPADAKWLTVGIDVGKWRVHWVVGAWFEDGGGLIVDYGVEKTGAEELSEEIGLTKTFSLLYERFSAGWTVAEGGGVRHYDGVVPDSGYQTALINRLCKKFSWWPSKGHGKTARDKRTYLGPKSTGTYVLRIGDSFHWARVRKTNPPLLEFDADSFKLWLHNRLNTPDGQLGQLRLWGTKYDHLTYSQHLTAEQLVEEQGEMKWRKVREGNHWLDATILSALAARAKGMPSAPNMPLLSQPPLPTPVVTSAPKTGARMPTGQGVRSGAGPKRGGIRSKY